ncbi:metallophosphoesterase N-terminal domain-containing protein [Prevotella sp. AGR2160]|uniref:metallophosphoesterase N-terminal domain-containing protein n=1 Tax=Prevotella sp. AGR2160 TaxID=1280674 RepID=UPI0004041B4E|nr:metallophosphoesterase N-terminal domain-containing protein [Prevotella sp. AGR2160]
MNRFLLWGILSAFSVSAMAQQTLFHLRGEVRTTDGKGIAGVVVNDGIHFTTTDTQGRWALDCDTCLGKFVAISTPAAYALNNDHGLARFYIPVREAVKRESNDFVLKKRKTVSDKFTYIAISDPQMRDAYEVGRWKNETLRDLRHTVDSLKGNGEIIGMTLGDLVFDTPNLFPQYAASCQNLGMVIPRAP